MLKAKDLVPGRVITELKRSYDQNGQYEWVEAWMVIGFQERVKRRHNKSTAPREGWDVVLLSFGGRLDVRNFTDSSMRMWKRLI
jgi:hypothetical protein